MLAITLVYLANRSVLRQIATQFSRSVSDTWKSIQMIVGVLEAKNGDVIKWQNDQMYLSVAEQLYSMSQFSQTLGAIDGCHIRVEPPVEMLTDYLLKMFPFN